MADKEVILSSINGARTKTDKKKKRRGKWGERRYRSKQRSAGRRWHRACEHEKRFSGSWKEEVLGLVRGRMRVTGGVDGSKNGRDKVAMSYDRKLCLTSGRHGGNIALISERKNNRLSDLWWKNGQNNWRPWHIKQTVAKANTSATARTAAD